MSGGEESMLRNKGFWYFLMAGAIALWIGVICLGFVLFPNNTGSALLFPCVLFLMHCAEIPVSSKIGRDKGLSLARVGVKTIIFGFTWWVPVKKGVFDL
jgi:uncharacterized membrane protein HdeD (DUF308 family)